MLRRISSVRRRYFHASTARTLKTTISGTPDVVEKGNASAMEAPKGLDDKYAGSYLYPSLAKTYDPKLGRSMRASASVTAGTVPP